MNTWTVSLEASLRGSAKCQEKLCARVQGWTALKIKQPAKKKKTVQKTKPGSVEWKRRPLMKPAGPSPGRQRRGGGVGGGLED